MTEITPWWGKFGQAIKSHFSLIYKTAKNIIATDFESQNNSRQGNILRFPGIFFLRLYLVKT